MDLQFYVLTLCVCYFELSNGFSVIPGYGPSYKDDVYEQCDYYTYLTPGNEYYITNPSYPAFYTQETHCRWVNHSPPNTTILLKCYVIDLSQSYECTADSVQVSLSGNLYMTDATKYCGKQSFEETSHNNKLVVTLEGNIMGKLLCAMKIRGARRPVEANSKSSSNCECGKKFQMHNRIVNGNQTGVNEYPFAAGLVVQQSNLLFCGASILTPKWAVTAAHCKEPRVTTSNTILLVGDHDLSSDVETDVTQKLRIKEFHVHQSYNSKTARNDIALVELEDRIEFSQKVMPICLPYHLTKHNFEGENVKVLGWGTTSFGGPTSKVLMETTLQVKPVSECQEVFREVSNQQLCTYGQNTDACQADSGGPVIYWDGLKRRYFLIGLISYGRGCAEDVPAVNTLVACQTYLDWIESKVTPTEGDSCVFGGKN